MTTLPAELRASKAASGERRQSGREAAVTPGLLRSLDEPRSTSQQVLVMDVSLHGVGFRSARKLATGSRFEIEIAEGTLRLTSRLHVVRTVLRLDGTYEIGGEFL
jgi:hypothetical protein